MIVRGLNGAGEIVEHNVTPLSADETAARRAAREARRPKPPLAGLAFLARLADAEYAAILNAAAAALAAGQPQLSRWLDELRVNGEINIAGAAAQAAKTALVTAGLLTADRADAIFAA